MVRITSLLRQSFLIASWLVDSASDKRAAGCIAPALAMANEARVLSIAMDPVAVDQVERQCVADGPAATGAQVRRYAFATLHVPTVLQFSPRKPLSLGARKATVEPADGSALFEEVAPI
jgi:hypothetical protein